MRPLVERCSGRTSQEERKVQLVRVGVQRGMHFHRNGENYSIRVTLQYYT